MTNEYPLVICSRSMEVTAVNDFKDVSKWKKQPKTLHVVSQIPGKFYQAFDSKEELNRFIEILSLIRDDKIQDCKLRDQP